MPPASRILQTNHTDTTNHSPPSASASASPPEPPLAVNSDVIVILAALLCALICVVGLAAVARCAWTRRAGSSDSAPPSNKGLKKKALESLPKIAYEPSKVDKLAECAICLAEFVEGEEVRILPQCGHGFHVGCIDTWLGSHSSCPSCRRVLVVPLGGPQTGTGRCRLCGGSSSAAVEMAVKTREDGQGSSYLS
jgi:Ring finger domain